MQAVYICDGVRTPIGRYAGGLASIRVDDLAALPLTELMQRYPQIDWNQLDDVIMGCANQAGEDNRNVARMAVLLAGLPQSVPAVTVNRLCGSGLNAVGDAARAIATGEAQLMIAAGVEGMSRAPLVMAKAEQAFGRTQTLFDTTMGWRFVNKKLAKQYGVEVMPQTAENLADHYNISRIAQDKFAFASQTKAAAAIKAGHFEAEIVPVTIPVRKGEPIVIQQDEHPRLTSLEKLAQLKPLFAGGTVTAGNASGINDGAAAVLLASAAMVEQYQLMPKAKVLGMTTVGVTPSMMGIGPVAATQKLLTRLGLTLADMDIIELNEAFAAQALSCMQQLGISEDDTRVNPKGGAIALGHPLGMSGSRLVITAMQQLQRSQGRYALCTMCIGVGQGIAMVLERVTD
ncbi:3-oxoadipyl-CoA thiolase [Shewanella marina]|uniref:3-oxoadipyl-CoA thiolase n=1 Tax=Shewanella marina TaxID=487319 RepID=UPI00046F580D|nr:3-oxoadipyl-CoA thiolase [Shewanella marina]